MNCSPPMTPSEEELQTELSLDGLNVTQSARFVQP